MQEESRGPALFDLPAESTLTLVCVLDRDGRILLFNEGCERASGFSRDEVLGQDACDWVIPREEREPFRDLLAHIWRTGLPSPQVGHWQTKDGGRRLIAWSNKLVFGQDGEGTYLITTGLDLTDRAGGDESAFAGDIEAKLAEIGRLAQEQRALRRVATLVASEATPDRVFAAVSEECARVFDVNACAVLRYEGDDTATVVARHSRADDNVFPLGARIPADERSTTGTVLRTGASVRIDNWPERDGEVAESVSQLGYRTTVAAPIVVAGILWGTVAIGSATELAPETETRLAAFCELVSLAVASAQAREDLRASRARLVKAGDEQRRRLERNLHDGAQQRLVAVALGLRVAQRQLETDVQAVPDLLATAGRELDLALGELRELARGLHPAALADHGLARALEGLASRLPLDVDIDVLEERLPEHVEATAFYIVSESLTNVVRHAGASSARVCVTRDAEALRLEIADDGRGGADPSSGSGILGLRDRAEAAGGTLHVVSPPGQGTVVTARLALDGG
jgi:PAS domain S-box-containing protein